MLTEQTVNGERVILANNGALVASKSQAGSWHVVKVVNGERTCDCKGYQYRGTCAHLRAVEQLERKRVAKRDTAILAGPAIAPPLFPESRKWERPAARSFEELFGQSA